MEYLITDIRTLVSTWVSAPSVRVALIAHENGWRTVKLPASSAASVYSEGDVIDASLGESSCRGLRANVTRCEHTKSASYASAAAARSGAGQ